MVLLPLSEEQVLERLRQDNPWWANGETGEEYSSLQKRLYFNNFYPLARDPDIKRAVILMGPRRVGKTVLIHHVIRELIRDGVSAHRIAYASVDNPFYNKIHLEKLFQSCLKATGSTEPTGWYMFFDEVQYLKDWEIHLKTLVDTYPGVKFIASGSAAAALKLKSNESGAGRFTDFMLPPLTFHEYIHLLGLQNLIIPSTFRWPGSEREFYGSSNLTILNEHFLRYINFGGYPEIIFSEKMQQNPSRFIKSDIIDKVLLKDLPGLYGIQDVQELNSLFTSIAYNSGQEFSLEALSQNSGGVEKNTIKRYIQYLEAAFLIKRVYRIDQTGKRFKRANFFKIYLTNPSIRSALFSPIHLNNDLIGAMVETAIFAQWLQIEGFEPWYSRWNAGRTKGEVDMVGLSRDRFKPVWANEIKWSNRYFDLPGELKSLIDFCKSNGINDALVTSIDKTGTRDVQDVGLHFIPAALYAYSISESTGVDPLPGIRFPV